MTSWTRRFHVQVLWMPRLCKASDLTDLTLFDDVGKKARSSKHKDRKCPCSWNSHLHVISVSLHFIFVHPPKFSPRNLLKNPNPPKKHTEKHIDTWHLTIWQTIKNHRLDIWPTTYPGLSRIPRKSFYIAWDFQVEHSITTYFAFSPPYLGDNLLVWLTFLVVMGFWWCFFFFGSRSRRLKHFLLFFFGLIISHTYVYYIYYTCVCWFF